MINKKSIETYMLKLLGKKALSVHIEKLGAGVQGAGFLIDVKKKDGHESYVIKGLYPEGLEHDYPADRAGVFLLDLEEFQNLPRHVRAIDVLAEKKNGVIQSIGGGKEYYLLMEKAEGDHYFHDLQAFAGRDRLEISDMEKIQALSSYLAKIHSVKKESKALHWRKVRDTIGHGECLMGVFDTYPDGILSYEEMAEIEKKCVDWRARLKPKYRRLCQVHGDFHPGNIWFQNNRDFILLDRSRGPWGDAADDVTALTINYIFFSIRCFGRLEGAYREALDLFYSKYVNQSGDYELLEVVAPFYAFRGAVVANPVFYPDVSKENRQMIMNFVNAVLDDNSFRIDKVNEYIG
ncbi:MAG: phosphotransferase [Nitrospiraceae bacterium]|nr:MAG: phosphotransferase [Nitrospiraceae bacterium]